MLATNLSKPITTASIPFPIDEAQYFNRIRSLYDLQDDESALDVFIASNNLADFLLWVHGAIETVFGKVEKNLHLYQSMYEDSPHLVLTVFSGLDDMDELTRIENQLFEKLENYPQLTDALEHIVIAQR
jgi:hypothetical protein